MLMFSSTFTSSKTLNPCRRNDSNNCKWAATHTNTDTRTHTHHRKKKKIMRRHSEPMVAGRNNWRSANAAASVSFNQNPETFSVAKGTLLFLNCVAIFFFDLCLYCVGRIMTWNSPYVWVLVRNATTDLWVCFIWPIIWLCRRFFGRLAFVSPGWNYCLFQYLTWTGFKFYLI